MSVSTFGAVTTYTNRIDFDAAAGPTRTIDFSSDDNGDPITDPSSDTFVDQLSLSGVCFEGGFQSYYNLFIYNFPSETIDINLPPGTFSFATDLSPFYDLAGTHTIILNSSETFSIIYDPASPTGSLPYFFGIVSDDEIRSISITYDTTYHYIDNFSITASAGVVAACPTPPEPVIEQGFEWSTHSSGLNHSPTGIAVAPNGSQFGEGNVFISHRGNPNVAESDFISRVDTNGNTSTFAVIGSKDPGVIEFGRGAFSDNLFIGTNTTTLGLGDSELLEVDEQGSVTLFAETGGAASGGIAFDESGQYNHSAYVGVTGLDGIMEVTTSGSAIVPVFSTFPGPISGGPVALHFTQNAGFSPNLHIAVDSSSPSITLPGIYTVAADGVTVNALATSLTSQYISQPGFDGMAFANGGSFGNDLYVSDAVNGTILRIDATGSVSVFASGLSNPQGTAFDGTHALYVVEAGLNRLLRITPQGQLDQSNDPGYANCSATLGLGAIEPPAFAQTITAGIGGLLAEVHFGIQRPSDYAAGDLTLQIRNVVAGKPGSIVLGEKVVPAIDLLPFPSDALEFVAIDVRDLGIYLGVGNQFAITWTREPYTGTGGKELIFYCTNGPVGDPNGVYLNGEAFYSEGQLSDWTPFDSWMDFRFRTFVIAGNEAPTADAGNDQSIREGDTVILDGSGSFDDNTATSDLLFNWSFATLPAGSAAVLTGANTQNPTFIADLAAATYELQLTVTDAEGISSLPDTVIVSADNLAPNANAGPDQLVLVGSQALLDGTQSTDPEMDPLTYSWTLEAQPLGSTAILSSATSSLASLTPDMPGLYEISLDVSDFIGPGTPATVFIIATTAADFAQSKILEADSLLSSLPTSQVTTKGNQNALSNFLDQAVIALQSGDTEEAIQKLEKAISRTDGCELRGSADGNGPGRDWVIACSAQITIYDLLQEALGVL